MKQPKCSKRNVNRSFKHHDLNQNHQKLVEKTEPRTNNKSNKLKNLKNTSSAPPSWQAACKLSVPYCTSKNVKIT